MDLSLGGTVRGERGGKGAGCITCLLIMHDARVEEEGTMRGAWRVDQWYENCCGIRAELH